MTDYSQLSDFEITCAVAKNLHPEGEILDVKRDITGSNCTIKFGPHGYKGFNPCNSWADAGPIIHEEMISIVFDDDGYDTPQSAWCKAISSRGEESYGDIRKPLRTAMIVYLLTKESESS